MMLYRPAPDEILPLLEKARRKWPSLLSRIDKAERLLTLFELAADAGRFSVLAQSNLTGDAAYTVHCLPGPRLCLCNDFQQGQAPLANGLRFCKHLIAVQAYLELLRTHLAHRLVGSTRDPGVRHYAHTSPNTYLARLNYTRTLTTLDEPSIYIQTTFGARGTTFATDADAIAFSQWLYAAEPVPGQEANLLFPFPAQPQVATTTHAKRSRGA